MYHGYIRCSTVEQADGATLDEQRRVINGMAVARGIGSWDISIYEDVGVSGSKPLRFRPEGLRLWEAAQQGDVVVASKLDRLFRNALDALKVLQDWKDKGVDLVLYDLGPEPVTRDGGIAKLFFTMAAAFAEHERERIRERIAEGKAAKRQRGGHLGGPAPSGFRIEGHGREARPVPCEREQEILRTLRAWGLDINPAVAAKKLTELGHVSRKGKPFKPIQVERLIRAAGDALWNSDWRGAAQ
jgi:DNA invertase Pin-like site-specific DNA recombinase